MSSRSKILIILPFFPQETKNLLLLRKSVDCIMSQTYTDFVLVIVASSISLKLRRYCKNKGIVIVEAQEGFISLQSLLIRFNCEDVLLLNFFQQLKPQYLEMMHKVLLSDKSYAFICTENKTIKGNKVENENDIKMSDFSAYDLLEANSICESIIMLRTQRIMKMSLCVNNEFIFFDEIYNAIFEMLRTKVQVKQLVCTSVFQEKRNPKYISKYLFSRNNHKVLNWIQETENKVKSDYVKLPECQNKLSVCITFLNEGEEVVNTVKSIRETVGNSVEIIVINDASTDCYDYEKHLRPFNVYYFVNEYRIGSSAGKEKAIQICNTPYFILLDAHMRFYDSEWAKIIVKELDDNPNQLLCCQSKALVKSSDGEIKDCGTMGVHGAYLQFCDNDYIPKIRWNGNLLNNKLKNTQIPVILGATYCSSKSYWNKLKGFQGLTQYGAEEEYISIKAWLEGGGCKYIPEIIIGHIYRKQAPYKVYTLQMLYNRFVITSTLFPRSVHQYASIVANKINSEKYKKVLEILSYKKEVIEELRTYYTKNFTKHDFHFVREINEPIEHDRRQLVIAEKSRLYDIVIEILEDAKETKKISIFDGRIGQVLVLAYYAYVFGNSEIDNHASDLFSEILSDLYTSDLPYGFYNGYSGIGWILCFFVKNNFIDDFLQKELNYIDTRISEIRVSKLTDFSFEKGIGGLLAYLVERLFSTKTDNLIYDKEFLDDLLLTCKKIIEKQDVDARTIKYALCFINNYMKYENYIPTMNLKTILRLPDFLPKEKDYQKKDIEGKYGYALNLINIYRDLKHYHSI